MLLTNIFGYHRDSLFVPKQIIIISENISFYVPQKTDPQRSLSADSADSGLLTLIRDRESYIYKGFKVTTDS